MQHSQKAGRKTATRRGKRPSYDAVVRTHYDRVAEESGLSHSSSMADEIIRAKETRTILAFVERVGRAKEGDASTVLDVGCGNGYTLRRLAETMPAHRYVGLEQNDRMREQAKAQLGGLQAVQLIAGDLRNLNSVSLKAASIDIVICQRVLINLMDLDDQQKGLDNIVDLARPGGALLFIEAFSSGLRNLNEARGEFGLGPIPPAPHNLYLPDDFFEHSLLQKLEPETFPVPHNLLSTHYFVSRVLHELALSGTNRKFTRNSHFVRFLSNALPDGIGEYAPLQICAFRKKNSR